MSDKEAPTSFDLASLNTARVEEGAVLDVLHPATAKPIGLRITLLGRDSAAVQEKSHKLANKRINDVAKAGGKLAKVLTSEDLDAEAVDVLVTATKSWEGLTDNGSTVLCTPDNARKLYTEHRWIREQVEAFINERGNFLGN